MTNTLLTHNMNSIIHLLLLQEMVRTNCMACFWATYTSMCTCIFKQA